ncbi:MAG: Hemerythrin cation binding domain protein [Mycobacterium sp.]|nr:Hemerythrin cation binding domain protein [Mycobacterium sp.]
MTTAGQSTTNLPEGDVVGILLAQHARIRELFEHVKSAEGEHKQQTFDELRALLAAHETAEEMVVRPVTVKAAAAGVADARNKEESEATHVLAELEKLGAADPKFDQMFAEFQKAVDSHATAEETQEFPAIAEKCEEKDRVRMGKALLAAEAVAPTHPHPSTAGSPAAQWAVGPVASVVDRVRDAVKGVLG